MKILETIKSKLVKIGLWDKVVEQELKSLWKYGVERIDNEAVRNSVIDFLEEEAPLSFFVSPASPSKKHHPKWQNKKAGMLRNTTECCLLADSQIQAHQTLCTWEGEILPHARDIILAATILSDTFKYNKEILNGKEIVSSNKTNKDHGKVAANIWRDRYCKKHNVYIVLADEIFAATYWHLGRWTEGWNMQTKFSIYTEIVHALDVFFADNKLELLYNPKMEIK